MKITKNTEIHLKQIDQQLTVISLGVVSGCDRNAICWNLSVNLQHTQSLQLTGSGAIGVTDGDGRAALIVKDAHSPIGVSAATTGDRGGRHCSTLHRQLLGQVAFALSIRIQILVVVVAGTSDWGAEDSRYPRLLLLLLLLLGPVILRVTSSTQSMAAA
jgi:hypothetical protein